MKSSTAPCAEQIANVEPPASTFEWFPQVHRIHPNRVADVGEVLDLANDVGVGLNAILDLLERRNADIEDGVTPSIEYQVAFGLTRIARAAAYRLHYATSELRETLAAEVH